MFKLMWVIAIITANGPVIRPIPETTQFKDQAACEQFGKDMTPRLQDWARGYFHLDWDVEVKSIFKCAVDGDPV